MLKIIRENKKDKIYYLKKTNGFCPFWQNETEETRCFCKSFRDKINRCEKGYCYFGLYKIEIE